MGLDISVYKINKRTKEKTEILYERKSYHLLYALQPYGVKDSDGDINVYLTKDIKKEIYKKLRYVFFGYGNKHRKKYNDERFYSTFISNGFDPFRMIHLNKELDFFKKVKLSGDYDIVINFCF